MRAKDLATLAGTTVRTIRYYHQQGLLAVPESETTWRSYGFAHLTRLMRIRWLVDSGVPLAEVPHMLRPANSIDEPSMVCEDLKAVLGSIDEKIAHLAVQREHVQTLLARVRDHGRLSPLPPSLLRLYGTLLQRPMPPALAEAVAHERDLLEFACYRNAMPADVVTLVEALGEADLHELCDLWEECHEVDQAAKGGLTGPLRDRIRDVVDRTFELADRVAPEATDRLLARALELQRPLVRAAVDLAYPSPTYRHILACVGMVATQRGAR